MNANAKLSFVIPCYKSEMTIQMVVDEIRQEMTKNQHEDYEIILVSDSSPDKVFQIICELARQDKRIIGLELAKNFGQHSALMAGYHIATGDYIVSMDDDGQIPVENTFLLIDRLEAGYDIVYASYANKARGIFRAFGTKVNDIMADVLLGKPKDIRISSFFAMKRYVKEEMIKCDSPFPYVAGLALRVSNRICNIPMECRRRQEGKSGYTFTKLFNLWLNGFTAFSVKPLRIATIIGAVCAVIGFLFGIFVIIHKLAFPATPAGYSSLMAVLLFISGMIMIMLGLIGEYVGRIYININNSPQYVIRKTIGKNCVNQDRYDEPQQYGTSRGE